MGPRFESPASKSIVLPNQKRNSTASLVFLIKKTLLVSCILTLPLVWLSPLSLGIKFLLFWCAAVYVICRFAFFARG